MISNQLTSYIFKHEDEDEIIGNETMMYVLSSLMPYALLKTVITVMFTIQ